MQITKTFCDRCGEEVIFPTTRKLYLSGLSREGGYDLCDSCYEELCKWFKDKEEVNADKGVLEKINEKQDSLRATCKAWDEAIEKDGYVD